MATLRIPFPEADTPAVVVLRGPRITVGRSLDNAIQIRDRTVSAHHLELIDEGDHYRLHDLGATNGVLVDGDVVTDFHLRKGCKIALGGVECEFSPETPMAAAGDPEVELVTRAECETLIREKVELVQQVTILREQVAAIQTAHVEEAGSATVPRTEFDRIIAELTAAKETIAERDRQLSRMVASRGILQRDRDNLQRLIDDSAKTPAGEGASAETAVRIHVPPQQAAPAGPTPKSAPLFVPPAATPAAPSSPQLPKPPQRFHPATKGSAAATLPMPVAKPVVSPAVPVAVKAGPKGTQRIKV